MKKEVDENVIKDICKNILKAILIIFYFLIFNLANTKVDAYALKRVIQACTMIFLLIAIYLFEKSYKKDDEKIFLEGIEVLVIAAYTLTTQHIVRKYDFNLNSYSMAAGYSFSIYFILKSIIIYTKERNQIAKKMSDIEEIVKKEEPVKKEATKKNKEKVEEKETAKKKTAKKKKVKLEKIEKQENDNRTKKEVNKND